MRTLASELRSIAAGLSARPRVYADANLPADLVTSLRTQLEWDVLHVIEHDDLRRAPDHEHFRRALEFGRTLITLDRDFFDARRFPADQSPGVVVCSAPDPHGLFTMLERLDRLVFRADPADTLPLRGRTLALTPDTDLRHA